MLSKQVSLLREKILSQIKAICEFVCSFYAKWYLQSTDAIKAPARDMSALHVMYQYRNVCSFPDAEDRVIESIYKHC